MGWLSSLVGGVVGFLVGGPVGAIIGAGLGATKVGEKVVNKVLDFVTKPFMPDMPDMNSGVEADRQQGVLVQTQGSTVSIPIVYGYRKVAGTVSFAETGATNNKYLYVAYVFSEGVVEGLREVFIDDWLLPVEMVANLNAGQLVNINSDKYSGRVQMRWSPGVYLATPRSSTLGTLIKGDIFSEAPSFTAQMVYNGLATLFVRYEWKEVKTQADADSNPFSGSIPEVQISVLGKRVASLLTNDTEAAPYDSNVVRYSTNPAEILLDYLRNPRYGKGLSNDDIDWTSWKIAARKCNQTVTYVASGIQGPILTMNAVIDTAATIMSNTKLLLKNFRGYMPYVQGKYKLQIEDAGNPTDILSGAATIAQTFTRDDIVSDVTYTGIEKSSKYTSFAITYVDPDQKWSNQTVVYPESESERQSYILQDGGRENPGADTYGFITNYAIAKDMARLAFNKQRRQETCVLTVSSKALELEPGDNIRIQSNILNFGTDPWRIISVKINNDMTVDLGCVRNPDDIYPYVRVGEEDIVLPTYIPKGSIIYFPGSQNATPIGLVPPTNALFPPDATPIPTNPVPTVPSDPGGGGVGGGRDDAGPTITEPTTPPTTPTSPDNNPPTPTPAPAPFRAALTLKSSSGTNLRNGTYYYNLVFTQPADGLYAYSIFWWRVNRFSPWQEIRKEERPGAGGDITVTFGPLPAGIYEFYVRSFASDGRSSIIVTQGQAVIRLNSTETNPTLSGIATANSVQVTDGWTIPGQDQPPAPRYDDLISVMSIRPKLSSGLPLSTRRLTVSLQQITDTVANSINNLIDGVRIFYKQRDDEYWSYEDFKFSAITQYYPGQTVTFDLAGDFGTRVYPSDIVPNSINDIQQRYDFLVRLTYADGKPAEFQLGPGRGSVEKNGLGQYDFITFGTQPLSSSGALRSQAIPVGFNDTFRTTDQAPTTPVGSALTLVPSIYQINSRALTQDRLRWTFNPPTENVSSFRGYKIRYREVVAGTNPVYTELTVGVVAGLDGRIFFEQVGNGFNLNTTYEWVITCQVRSGGSTVDATNSLWGRCSIPFNSTDDNEYPRFGFTVIDTQQALGQLRTTFPAEPTINAQQWIKRQVLPYSTYDTGFLNRNATLYTLAASYPMNIYLRLVFQAPATASHIICYRRVYSPTGIQRTTVGGVAKYYGLGPWERVRISLSSLSSTAAGFKILNLRGPLDYEYFNTYYQVAGDARNANLVDAKWGSTGYFPYATAAVKSQNIYPLSRYGVGNKDTEDQHQYLFVLEISSVEQTKGLLLTDFYTRLTTGTGYSSDTDGFISPYGNVSKTNIIEDVAIYNTSVDAGFGRRLSDAITAPALNQLYQSGTSQFGGAPPSRTSTALTSFNKFMANPVTGDTIY